MVGNFEERGNGSVGHEYYALAHMLYLKNVPLFLVQQVVCSHRQLGQSRQHSCSRIIKLSAIEVDVIT